LDGSLNVLVVPVDFFPVANVQAEIMSTMPYAVVLLSERDSVLFPTSFASEGTDFFGDILILA